MASEKRAKSGRPMTAFARKELKKGIIHLLDCKGIGYGDMGLECPSWVCDCCGRTVGYCMGHGDEFIELCNDCWGELPEDVREGKRSREEWEKENLIE